MLSESYLIKSQRILINQNINTRDSAVKSLI